MAESMFMPCNDWSEKLNSSSEDLSASDRAALEAHLKVCPACLLVSIDNKMISRLIHALPAPDFGIGLSPRLTQFLQQENECKARELQKSLLLIDIQQQALEVVSEVLQRPEEEVSETPPTSSRPHINTSEYYETTCADCGQAISVPFAPREDHPVYCSDCFQMRRAPRIHRHSWGTRINGPRNQDKD